jgi:DNA-3-methyladenine glycosylase II
LYIFWIQPELWLYNSPFMYCIAKPINKKRSPKIISIPMNRLIKDASIAELPGIDPIFVTILDQYGVPDMQSRPEGFESLCRIILEQQVSLMSAQATYEKLSTKINSFTPKEILTLTPKEMRSVTVSKQKASYMKGLATAILNGELSIDKLSELPPAEAKESLIAIKGIGPWTAQVYLIFCLQVADVFPQGDVALINTVVELTGVEKTEVQAKSEDWAPHRTGAALLLWHHYLKKRGRSTVM